MPHHTHRAGTSEPVLLLHGGLADGRTFDPLVAALPTGLDCWTVDRRGHGRTADSPEPFSYDDMVAEAVAFVRDRIGRPVHLVGHSDGASLALLLAVRYPELVRSVSAFSANTDPSGYEQGSVTVDEMVAGVGPAYAEVSPDGIGHFPTVVEKVFRLWATEPAIGPADLAAIRCPVLVAAGQHDVVRREHTEAIARGIPGAELVVVPGTSHMQVEEQPTACAELVVRTIARAT